MGHIDTALASLRQRNANDIEPIRDIRVTGAEGFTDSSSHPVSTHGVANAPAHTQPEPGPAKTVLGDIDDQHTVAHTALPSENPLEVGAPAQVFVFMKSLVGRHPNPRDEAGPGLGLSRQAAAYDKP